MTPQQIEAMKLALEALKKCHYYMIDAGLPNQSLLNKAFTAYKALEKALAQPKQEPVISKWVLREVYFDEDGEPVMHRSPPQPERHELQAKGEHPAPCARHCEANAFKIVIRNLKAQLAQPEQEPLEYWNAVEGWVKIDEVREHFDSVGCGTIYKSAGEGRAPLYTTPPQRKPLTDEEIINKCLESGFERNCLGWSFTYGKLDYHLLKLARAIEAAHNIKENT